MNAFNQKVEERKLGVTGGFHGVLRWSANDGEDSDELFEFLMLHHLNTGDNNSSTGSVAFQQSITVHLKAWGGTGSSESAMKVLEKLDKEFLPGVLSTQKKFVSADCNKEEEPEECPICMEESFTEPVFTDCAHMICWPCLHTVRSTPSKNRYKCPMCRSPYATVTSVNTKGNNVHQFNC